MNLWTKPSAMDDFSLKYFPAHESHVLNSTSGRFLYIAGKKNLEIPFFRRKRRLRGGLVPKAIPAMPRNGLAIVRRSRPHLGIAESFSAMPAGVTAWMRNRCLHAQGQQRPATAFDRHQRHRGQHVAVTNPLARTSGDTRLASYRSLLENVLLDGSGRRIRLLLRSERDPLTKSLVIVVQLGHESSADTPSASFATVGGNGG